MTNETANVFVDLSALIAAGAAEAKTGAKGKSVSPWVVEMLAKVAKGEKVAIAPAVWEKGNGKARRAFKADAANVGHVLRAKMFKNGSAVVAYVVTRELDV